MSDPQTTDEQIALAQFVREEKERIDRFSDWWMKRREQDRDNFPLLLPPGEWDEQLLAWGDMIRDE